MESFTTSKGDWIVLNLIQVIQENKQYLSDIDGAIGDGDHGINMNKGVTLCLEELKKKSGDLSFCLKVLSRVLMMEIGGSIGPLYGMLFKAMSQGCYGKEIIDARIFGDMLKAGVSGVQEIGNARVGDKTLLDSLVPAVDAYNSCLEEGKSFKESLEVMKIAAINGRDSTTDMIAKVGRSSRLGERSKGVLDAGATSCCLIICSIADSISTVL